MLLVGVQLDLVLRDSTQVAMFCGPWARQAFISPITQWQPFSIEQFARMAASNCCASSTWELM